ncbi:probable methyltransferase-like protein 25 isoform X2 [Ylistrum balloti]|uniref:probable methyltransferase-like protein 25 isoform X2 n=1 Tax=Ylistrum balloti TaxID=509963 RepID=UPI002905A351|nr:probable methyltransferase-like protein 25 isoform X2 [Ylistrum balloti]
MTYLIDSRENTRYHTDSSGITQIMETSNHKLALKFLVEYEWVYNFQLTKFFVNKVWDKIPREEEWPDSLKNFIRTALTLSLPRSQRNGVTPVIISPDMCRGMTPKKQHEVSLMSAVVHDVARQANCDVILDIGSGLGYLGQILQKQFGYNIIGFESKQCHTSGAERRAVTGHQNGIHNVTFELEKGQENMDKFSKLVYNTCQLQNCCSEDTVSKSEVCRNCDQVPTDSKECDSVDKNKPVEHKITVHDDLVLRRPPLVTVEGHRCVEDVSTHRQKCKSDIQYNHNETKTGDMYSEKCETWDSDLDNLSLSHKKEFLPECESSQPDTKADAMHQSKDLTLGCECRDGNTPDSHLTLTKLDKPLTLTLPRALMIGLHCCGDLTPTMMEYFRCLDFVRGLCCVSCCYHRMKVKAENETLYNFPMSAATSKIYNKVKGDNPLWGINTFALRLAAQETRGRWGKQTAEDHDYHTKNVGYRGILELYTSSNTEKCDKMFRKIARKSDYISFTAYVDAACSRLKYQAGEDPGIDKTELFRLFEENKDKMKYIEPLTALQYLMQPVLEGLINTDRALYLQDHGISTEIVPIFNEVISPRNLALISVK